MIHWLSLNPSDDCKCYLYDWSKNWELIDNLRHIHLRNYGLSILVDWHWLLVWKKENNLCMRVGIGEVESWQDHIIHL